MPSITVNGALPDGVMFNGMSGELFGTPSAGSTGGWPLVITASNGVMPNATQILPSSWVSRAARSTSTTTAVSTR